VGEELSKRIRQERFDSPVQEAVLNLIVAADHVRQQVEAICEANGISGPQYNVLRILKGVHPDGHPRCEIIRRMLEKAPDVTRLVDRLEHQKLVERVRSDEDRRLSITRITQTGLDLLNTMDPAMQRLNRDFGERISRRDCRELSRICEGIYAEDQ